MLALACIEVPVDMQKCIRIRVFICELLERRLLRLTICPAPFTVTNLKPFTSYSVTYPATYNSP